MSRGNVIDFIETSQSITTLSVYPYVGYKWEKKMELNVQTDGLHSLLFCEGRQLENFKFFPGTRAIIEPSELLGAAEAAIRSALERGLTDIVPRSGKNQSEL